MSRRDELLEILIDRDDMGDESVEEAHYLPAHREIGLPYYDGGSEVDLRKLVDRILAHYTVLPKASMPK